MSHYVPTETEMLTLLKQPDLTTWRGMRDRAILELLYSSALRRQEVVNLNVDSVNLSARTVRVIKGKWRKDRFTPMTRKAAEAIRVYLSSVRPLLCRNTMNNALFLAEWGRRLTSGMINETVCHYNAFNPRICVHSIRHATATHMLKRGANILYLQRLLGHNSPATTQIYTRLYPKDLLAVYEKYHPRAKRQTTKRKSRS